MRKTTTLVAGAAAVALLAGGQAAAQQPQAPGGSEPRPEASAGGCVADLAALDRRMDDDGFWLSGYRASYGWTGVATPPGTGPNMGARAPGLAASGGAAVAGIAPARSGQQPAGAEAATASPFAGVDWRTAPAQALRTLFAAAQILAQQGNEEACRTVLGEAQRAYDDYAGQLRRAGVEPGEIRNYRQKQLALARPLGEQASGLRLDGIEGTELRGPGDEYLGYVEDAVIDPRTGRVEYVVVGRGGFLGFGRDRVAVPLQRLRATPGLDAFVLDMSRRELDAAPRVEPADFATADGYARRGEEIERFWRQTPRRDGGRQG